MTDPRQREDLRIRTRDYEVRSHPHEDAGIRVGSARVSAAFDQRPFEEIQHSMQLRRGPWIPESALWPMMRRERALADLRTLEIRFQVRHRFHSHERGGQRQRLGERYRAPCIGVKPGKCGMQLLWQ